MSSLRMRYTETLFTEKLIPQSQTTCMCTSWDQLGPVGVVSVYFYYKAEVSCMITGVVSLLHGGSVNVVLSIIN